MFRLVEVVIPKCAWDAVQDYPEQYGCEQVHAHCKLVEPLIVFRSTVQTQIYAWTRTQEWVVFGTCKTTLSCTCKPLPVIVSRWQ